MSERWAALVKPPRLNHNFIPMKPRFTSRVALVAMALLAAAAAIARAGAPPDDLVKLERRVSLQLAHVRDLGPTDPDKRKQLSDANQLDREGEDAIKAGDYKAASDRLNKADAILIRLLGD